MNDRQSSRREPGDIDGRADRPGERERASQPLGDIPAEEFRKQLHELADWIADYREHIGERRIAPNIKPGAILAQLDKAPPETSASLDDIFSDIYRVIVPGVVHWPIHSS